MWLYWLMFLFPAAIALGPERFRSALWRWSWPALACIYVFAIGFRHQIGGDWVTYLASYQRVSGISLREALLIFGFDYSVYSGLNWVSSQLQLGIYGVNLVCGAIAMYGVFRFANAQPMPWIAIVVAVPYLIIVVAMGYTRQSVVIGIGLLALLALERREFRRSLLLAGCAALFHKSALVIIPLILVVFAKSISLRAIIAIVVSGFVSGLLLWSNSYQLAWDQYIVDQMESKGALIRGAMNALPATLLLVYSKRLFQNEQHRVIWRAMAIGSIACLPLALVASTLADRLAIYFIPIQLLVYARIHQIIDFDPLRRLSGPIVVTAYGVVLWVWLSYSLHTANWVPYQYRFPFLQ